MVGKQPALHCHVVEQESAIRLDTEGNVWYLAAWQFARLSRNSCHEMITHANLCPHSVTSFHHLYSHRKLRSLSKSVFIWSFSLPSENSVSWNVHMIFVSRYQTTNNTCSKCQGSIPWLTSFLDIAGVVSLILFYGPELIKICGHSADVQHPIFSVHPCAFAFALDKLQESPEKAFVDIRLWSIAYRRDLCYSESPWE